MAAINAYKREAGPYTERVTWTLRWCLLIRLLIFVCLLISHARSISMMTEVSQGRDFVLIFDLRLVGIGIFDPSTSDYV